MEQTISTTGRSSLYHAVWRWHFYAGLLILPFLLLLAITGGIYVFDQEIDAFLYQDWSTVEARSQPMLDAGTLVQRAGAAMPGEVARITLPSGPTAAALVVTTPGTGGNTRFFDGQTDFMGFVDPYTGQVLGVASFGGIMDTIRNLHSLSLFGFAANCLIEIVTGWCLILVATGTYLWWPRGARGGVVSIRGAPRQRVFWRDLHAVTGLCAGLVIGFIALTGMPWSPVWGDQLHALVANAGLSDPPVPASSVPGMPRTAQPAGMATTHAEHMGTTNWTLDPMPVPNSEPMQSEPIGLDRAVAIFNNLGMPAGYQVALPRAPQGVYSASWRPDSGTGTRVIHLDQYTGEVLADLQSGDFGAGSQAIGWSISVHQGNQFGPINQIIMFAACVAIILLTVTGSVMWWKRRPAGALGVPPAPQDPRSARTVTAIIATGGVLFPLVGLSLLVALALDWLIRLVARKVLLRRATATA